jgi:hypothetical protein
MKIYISGKITGENMDYARTRFENAANKFIENGHEVINPFDINEYDPFKTWEMYMKEDIKALVDCDAIRMLRGWHKSKGAKLEFYIAVKLGLTILFE